MMTLYIGGLQTTPWACGAAPGEAVLMPAPTYSLAADIFRSRGLALARDDAPGLVGAGPTAADCRALSLLAYLGALPAGARALPGSDGGYAAEAWQRPLRRQLARFSGQSSSSPSKGLVVDVVVVVVVVVVVDDVDDVVDDDVVDVVDVEDEEDEE